MASHASRVRDGAAAGPDIGRHAHTPRQIPARGWKQVLGRVRRSIAENRLGLIAAGVAFYSLLAVFPGIAALISVYGLVSDPHQIREQFSTLQDVIPADAYALLSRQMQDVASRSDGALGVGLIGAILLAMWSATRSTTSLITALNIVYKERERRSFLHLKALSYGLTVFLVLLAVVAISLIVALPVVLGYLGLGSIAETLVNWLRWPVLGVLVLFFLAVVYRFGPCRQQARWHWVSWGSVGAVALWLLVSALFSLYVSNFGNFNATYGTVGAVIVLLMWLFLTAFVLILGGSVNAEMELQTEHDTTTGRAKPRGKRGAWVADHLPDDNRSAR
ncbi:MAG: YihY/virulence factor BrkB family protein [Chromatocurvus sp.]